MVLLFVVEEVVVVDRVEEVVEIGHKELVVREEVLDVEAVLVVY